MPDRTSIEAKSIGERTWPEHAVIRYACLKGNHHLEGRSQPKQRNMPSSADDLWA
jgi:hypothetical protein